MCSHGVQMCDSLANIMIMLAILSNTKLDNYYDCVEVAKLV